MSARVTDIVVVILLPFDLSRLYDNTTEHAPISVLYVVYRLQRGWVPGGMCTARQCVHSPRCDFKMLVIALVSGRDSRGEKKSAGVRVGVVERALFSFFALHKTVCSLQIKGSQSFMISSTKQRSKILCSILLLSYRYDIPR